MDLGHQSHLNHRHCGLVSIPPPQDACGFQSQSLCGRINDLTSILTSEFHGTLEPLIDSDLNALAQTTFLLLQHADATPITSPDCPPVLRVPRDIPTVPLETYHNKAKPHSQQETRLLSPILRRSPRNHPLSHQTNTVLEPAIGPETAPHDRPYLAHVEIKYQFMPAKLGQASSSPKTVKFAEDIGRQPLPLQWQTTPAISLTMPPSRGSSMATCLKMSNKWLSKPSALTPAS